MATKKITLNELRSILKQIIKEEMILLKEEANTDLELKSVAKQIFSVLKKYGLKPTYEVDGKQFQTKKPQAGYGARVHIGNNGIMTVAVYDRGIWQTLKKQTNELDMGPQSYPTDEEKKQINQIANKIYNDITSTLGQDKFEFRSQSKPNQYGEYIIQIRKKGGQVNPNQRPNAPQQQAQRQQAQQQPQQQRPQQQQQQPVSENLRLRNYFK